MNRRQFVSSSGAAVLGAATPAPQRARMKVGASVRCEDARLKAAARYGIGNIITSVRVPEGRLYATADELKRMRETAEKNGIRVDVVSPPFLESTHVDVEKHAAIMLGESPQRDRDIEALQTMIKNCAAAGIPCIKYNLTLLGVLRSSRGVVQGRGDTTYNVFRLKDALAQGAVARRTRTAAELRPDPPLTRAGRVPADMYWERITYFLERIIPVAEEYRVRMACHPQDPGLPPEGYQGIQAVLSSVEGLKKFITIKESPYHGLNFCQGTVSSMLQDPGKEIYDVIRYFGSRKKIFLVHFRNIRGRRYDFAEVAIDEGDVDMLKAVRAYKGTGYDGILHYDHVVRAAGDPNGEQYAAFCYGYIRALIQAADRSG
ncbi:MAG: mannonate dehydratase [Bryobacteraceae bacterium]